jgi:DnaK suppressor protein
MRRVQAEDFGVCTDCGVDIPFDRLKVEPWATRCVACESAQEARAAH